MFKKTKISTSLMLAFGGSLALGALPALAQQQQPQEAAKLDRVEITGSSIRRIETEGALQVQTISRTEIDRLGVQTTEQLLQTVSAMSSSGQTQNSTGAGLSTYGQSGVSLRGLGQERTLVLLNGRRLAAFAGGGGASINVNAIPLAAIERVEVLKDGASAIYGSDAVAGVVNFILVKNFEGLQIGGTYGTPTQSGGGQQYQANVVFGVGDLNKDRYSLTLSGQYQKDELLFGKDRTFASNGNKPPLFVNSATGQGNIQGAWVPSTGSIAGGDLVPGHRVAGYVGGGAGGGFGNPMAALGQCASIKMFDAGLTSQGVPFCQYDSAPDVGLLPKTEATSFTLNFVYKLNEKAELFADGVYAKSVITQQYQPAPARTSFFETDDLFAAKGVDPVLLLRPTNPAYKIASDYLKANGLAALDGQTLGITDRVFDFGPRSDQSTTTQERLVVGIRGDIMGQDYTVAVAQNQSQLSASVLTGYWSQVGFAKATQDPSSDWNPWSSTQSDAFNALIAPAKYVGPSLNATSRSTNFDATISGSIMPMPAGELQYAAGYQYRKESLTKDPSPALLSGDIAGLGGAVKPLDQSRNITSLFGELNIPVIKNLDVNVAARYDGYSDVGSTDNYKANLRWQPVQSVLVRASYGTGFRAPTLNDLWYPQVLGTSSQFNDPVTGQNKIQANEVTGGNPNLTPETSKQGSFGIVFQPMASLSLGIDFFNIKVDNVIATPATQEVVSQNALGNPAYAGLVIRDPVTKEISQVRSITANTGTMSVQGFDVDVRYKENLGPGNLAVTLNGTYYSKFDQSTPGGGTSHKVGTTVDYQGNPLISSNNETNDASGVVLRYKQYLAATWTQGAWATTLGNQFALGYGGGYDTLGNPTHMPRLSLWDAQVAWSGVKNMVLTLGGRNIFGQGPTFFVPSGNQFQVGYDATQYDPRGRFVYLTGTYKF